MSSTVVPSVAALLLVAGVCVAIVGRLMSHEQVLVVGLVAFGCAVVCLGGVLLIDRRS